MHSSAAADWWVASWSQLADPARSVLLDLCRVGAGTSLLDIGCGSGELASAAVERDAAVVGIDAAPAMIEHARRRAPGAEFHVGSMERLPFANSRFDAAVAVNALQFAASLAGALDEAVRVVRPGGRVALCNWGRPEDQHVGVVKRRLEQHAAPQEEGEVHTAAILGLDEPGALEAHLRRVGVDVEHAGDVDVPLQTPDLVALAEALVGGGGLRERLAHLPQEVMLEAVASAAEPYRRHDGGYALPNTVRYVVGRKPRGVDSSTP